MATLNDFVDASPAYAAGAIRPLCYRVIDRYHAYEKCKGNPWSITPSGAHINALKSQFHDVYTRTPYGFGFIGAMRREFSGTCPMCGSRGNGTIDHYLPKGLFPEFSFFSLNLIPCCAKCNNLRNDAFHGAQQDARPVHPYFDGVAADDSLVEIVIQPDYSAPLFVARPAVDPTHPLHDAVKWHLENIIVPAGLERHCQYLWGRLIAMPLTLCGRTPTIDAIRSAFEIRLNDEMGAYSSLNSWDACFYLGLHANDDALEYLRAHLAAKLHDTSHREETGIERALRRRQSLV